MAELGLRGAQELPPHGRVEEQVVYLQGRAHRTAAGRQLAAAAGGHLQFRAAGAFGACGCAAPGG